MYPAFFAEHPRQGRDRPVGGAAIRWDRLMPHGRLSLAEEAQFAELYRSGAPRSVWLREFPGATINTFMGRITKLNLHRDPRPTLVKGLKAGHPALVEGRTIFPSRVRLPPPAGPLVPGSYSAKLGAVVSKGAWRGMPIYSLALEERATCPRTCHHWTTCFASGMPLAWRNRHGMVLEVALHRQLSALQRRHPAGFVVRAHVIGDFYSAPYVARWASWLDIYPALRVFGYTAWQPDTEIGAAVERLADARWDRFAVRLSSTEPGPRRAITLWEMPEKGTHKTSTLLICPAQTGKTKSCASCSLCWAEAARGRTIAFIAHGPVAGRKAA